ncbi:hypothetical protein [Nonomuraea sp. NPDC003804]|uniref:hypothetical protein n=1 Tax=Nonomuraea sp. NPDC003804 TaxID=3154547 RepID=UPI0033B9785B
MWAVVAQGVRRFALGERVYEYREGQYLIACRSREPVRGGGSLLRGMGQFTRLGDVRTATKNQDGGGHRS